MVFQKEVVPDNGEINIGQIHICDQQSLSYKRGGLSKGVLLHIHLIHEVRTLKV